MALIWRGMGIAVPIVFFLTGLLVSWLSGDTDARIGNANFIGWTSLWSGIVLTLLGLAALGMSEGEDANGSKVKKKHDFFFVPIVVWGLILGGLSLYLLVFTGKAAPSEPIMPPSDSLKTEVEAVEPTSRTVNFYNPSDAPMNYIVADENGAGLIEKGEVAPHAYHAVKLEAQTYMFIGKDGKGKLTTSFPDEKDASDESKYTLFEDEQGQFFQRIVNPETPETDDYDQAWIALDGKTGFLLVNVSTACDAAVTAKDVKGADWAGAIQEEYDGRDMMEPLYKKFLKDKMIQVVGPGEKLPTSVGKQDVVYLLVPYAGKGDKQDMILKAILAARF